MNNISKALIQEVLDPVHNFGNSMLYNTPGKAPGTERSIFASSHYVPLKIKVNSNPNSLSAMLSIRKLFPRWKKITRKRQKEFKRDHFPKIKKYLEGKTVRFNFIPKNLSTTLAAGKFIGKDTVGMVEPIDACYEELLKIL